MAFSRDLLDQKSKSPLFHGAGWAMVTNDQCFIHILAEYQEIPFLIHFPIWKGKSPYFVFHLSHFCSGIFFNVRKMHFVGFVSTFISNITKTCNIQTFPKL